MPDLSDPKPTPSAHGQVLILQGVQPKRGRAPAFLKFEGDLDISTFESSLVREAAGWIGRQVQVHWTEKPGKKEGAIYRNLVSAVPIDGPQEGLGDTPGGAPLSLPALAAGGPSQPSVEVSGGLVRMGPSPVVAPLSEMEAMEASFKVAVRRRELIEQFVQSRFKEGVHYMDGKTFSRTAEGKKVLLLPGAQLIMTACGLVAEYKILGGPMDAPREDQAAYTFVIQTLVRNIHGRIVGEGLGTCSSLIWSNGEMRYKPRAVSFDLTHNSTLKMAKKRSYIAGCIDAVAAAEFVTQDLDEYPPETDTPPARGSFIKKHR